MERQTRENKQTTYTHRLEFHQILEKKIHKVDEPKQMKGETSMIIDSIQ